MRELVRPGPDGHIDFVESIQIQVFMRSGLVVEGFLGLPGMGHHSAISDAGSLEFSGARTKNTESTVVYGLFGQTVIYSEFQGGHMGIADETDFSHGPNASSKASSQVVSSSFLRGCDALKSTSLLPG